MEWLLMTPYFAQKVIKVGIVDSQSIINGNAYGLPAGIVVSGAITKEIAPQEKERKKSRKVKERKMKK